jgi:thioredoxin 1
VSDLLEELKSGNHVIKLSASWCGPCKAYAPAFAEATKDVSIAKVHNIDVDDYPEVAQHFNLRGVPTTILLKDGEAKVIRAGNMATHEVKDLITSTF